MLGWGLLVINNENYMQKVNKKFRDTVLVRLDRSLKEEVKKLSERLGETMSKINDKALREYVNSMKRLD